MSLRFDGFDAWPENNLVVECYVRGELRDLHNCAKLLGHEWRSPGELWLWFTYDDRLCGGHRPPWRLGLGFGEVRGLTLEQAHDFDPREGSSLESLWYRSNDVEIEAGDLTLTFRATWARVVEQPEPDNKGRPVDPKPR